MGIGVHTGKAKLESHPALPSESAWHAGLEQSRTPCNGADESNRPHRTFHGSRERHHAKRRYAVPTRKMERSLDRTLGAAISNWHLPTHTIQTTYQLSMGGTFAWRGPPL